MKPTFLKTVIAAAVLLFFAAAPGWSTTIDVAPTVVLTSSGSGVYDYALDFPGYDDFTVPGGSTLTFTGMSGVTGTSTSGFLEESGAIITDGFTSTSATFEFIGDTVITNSGATDVDVEGITIDSSAPLGTIDWDITLASGDPGGTVDGPVSTPEPTSLALLLCGFAGLALLVLARRKQPAAAAPYSA